jgi:hypothetical protein
MAKKDNSFETKTKKVADYLITNKNITSWDAINKFKATRLSAIIFNLKKRGFIIETKMEINGNSNYGRYHFKGMKKK